MWINCAHKKEVKEGTRMYVQMGCPAQLSQPVISQLFRYRHDVFVKMLGWDLDTPHDIEIDEFDHAETRYVIVKDEENEIVGCARLLPTTAPYLLESVFPELLNGCEVPKSNEIWEISRFTNISPSSPKVKGSIGKNGQINEVTFSKLLQHAIECAKDQGAKRLISVSPIGIERLLRKAGVKAYRAGPPKVINGHAILACWIDID